MAKHKYRNTDSVTSIEPEAPFSAQDQEFSPTYTDIQVRAYQIHEQQGGSDVDNWLEAERQLREESRLGR